MRWTRRIILLVSLVLSLVIAAAWVCSLWRFDHVAWPRTDRIERDPAYADGTMGAWICHVGWRGVMNWRGTVSLMQAEYLSIFNTREDLVTQWSKADRSIKWNTGPVGKVAAMAPPRFWHDAGDWRGFGFGFFTTGRQGETSRVVELPHWLLLLIAGSPFAIWVVPAYIRRRRRSHSRCPACGYPAGVSPKCTECGAELPGPSASR